MKKTGLTLLMLGFAVWIGHAQVPASPRQPRPENPPQKQSKYDATSVSPQTAAFLKKVSEGNHAEIDLAKLAQSKARRDDVKSLAKRIEQDHQKNQDNLEALAGVKNVDLPANPNDSQKATAKRLGDLNGDAFDQAYLAEMARDHQTTINEFKSHATATDPEVAVFVKSTLPVLQYHQERVTDAKRQSGR